MTDWAYPDTFKSSSQVANWINVVGVVCCVFLLASWAVLPVEKTHRHYLSISLTCAVMFMNVSYSRPQRGVVGNGTLTFYSLALSSRSQASPSSALMKSRRTAWTRAACAQPLGLS